MDGYWTTAQWTDTGPQRNGRILLKCFIVLSGADGELWTDARDNLPNFLSSVLRWFDAVKASRRGRSWPHVTPTAMTVVASRDIGDHDSRGVT